MKTHQINFGTWYKLPSSQLKKLTPEENIRLGISIAKFKTPKKLQQDAMGIYVDIKNIKENRFIEICDTYDIMPSKTKN